jgi:hypothetical protein
MVEKLGDFLIRGEHKDGTLDYWGADFGRLTPVACEGDYMVVKAAAKHSVNRWGHDTSAPVIYYTLRLHNRTPEGAWATQVAEHIPGAQWRTRVPEIVADMKARAAKAAAEGPPQPTPLTYAEGSATVRRSKADWWEYELHLWGGGYGAVATRERPHVYEGSRNTLTGALDAVGHWAIYFDVRNVSILVENPPYGGGYGVRG